jgi:hypothetical protein
MSVTLFHLLHTLNNIQRRERVIEQRIRTKEKEREKKGKQQ